MLVSARDEVKAMLTERVDDLHALATALIDRETLTRIEIEQILGMDSQGGDGGSQVGASGGGSNGGKGGDERVGSPAAADAAAAAAPALVPCGTAEQQR
eukprot:359190-Chlamydomonas_euryale.AAC.1